MTSIQPLASLAFEPIVSTDDGALCGLQFVFTGEGTYGYAPAPGHQAPEVERLLEVLAEWQRAVPGLRLTIPACVTELEATALATHWLDAADSSSVNPAAIELGLDPASPPSSERRFGSNVAQLREAGVGIVQMGFSFGHASLALWHSIGFTRIDLHHCFVHATESHAEALLASIAELTSAQGLQMTASGVDSIQQAQMAKNSGIELMRGRAAGPMLSGFGIRSWLSERGAARAGH